MQRRFTDGALIAVGATAIVDNVVVHWMLGLQRAIPGPWAGAVEVGLLLLGTVLLIVGVWRELQGSLAHVSLAT